MSRTGDPRLGKTQVPRCPHHADRGLPAGGGSQLDHRRLASGLGRQRDEAAGVEPQLRQRHELGLIAGDCAVRADRDQMGNGVAGVRQRHRAVVVQGIPGLAEHPGRLSHVRRDRVDRVKPFDVDHAIDVPPVRAIRDDDEATVGCPLRLHQGLRLATGHPPGVVQPGMHTSPGKFGHPQLCQVPGHVRVVPGEPSQPATVRADPRRGNEIPSRHQDERLAAGRRDGHNLVAHLAPGVILPNADHRAGVWREPTVGIPPRVRRRRRRADRQRLPPSRLAARRIDRHLVDPIEPLVGPLDVEDGAAVNPPGASPILVDPGPGVPIRGEQFLRDAVRAAANDLDATALRGTAFRPPRDPALGEHVGWGGRSGDEHLGGDRRRP